MSQTTTPAELDDLPAWHRASAAPITLQVATDLAEQVCMVAIERDAMLVRHQYDAPALRGVVAPAVDLVRAACLAHARSVEAAGMALHLTYQDVLLGALLDTAAHLAYSLGEAAVATTYAEEAIERDHAIGGAYLSRLVLALVAIECPWRDLSAADRAVVDQALAEHRQTRG